MKKFVIVFFGFLLLGIASLSYAEELTPQLCKDKVLAAAKILEAEGTAGLAKIKDPNGEFRFADGQGYIWVHNLDGNMLMHPIKPHLDGSSVIELRDAKGVYMFVAFNEMAEENGQGWVPYEWPKPGDAKASSKVSFVKLISGDEEMVAGAGMYDVTADDIKRMFPGDAVYELD